MSNDNSHGCVEFDDSSLFIIERTNASDKEFFERGHIEFFSECDEEVQ